MSDFIVMTGVVKETLPGAKFRVLLEGQEKTILCHISGKIRKNMVRISLLDKVEVRITPYDLTQGRITRRL